MALFRSQDCLANSRGGIAVEFALVAPVFFLLLFGVLETSVLYFNAVMLESAVRDATRRIRTGEVQANADPLGTFQTLLCGELVGSISCANLTFYAAIGDSFGALTTQPLFDNSGKPIQRGFVPGVAKQIVMVQVGYHLDFVTPMVGQLLSQNGSGRVDVSVVTVFRNEPF